MLVTKFVHYLLLFTRCKINRYCCRFCTLLIANSHAYRYYFLLKLLITCCKILLVIIADSFLTRYKFTRYLLLVAEITSCKKLLVTRYKKLPIILSKNNSLIIEENLLLQKIACQSLEKLIVTCCRDYLLIIKIHLL